MDDRGTTAIRSPGADGSIFPKWCPIFCACPPGSVLTRAIVCSPVRLLHPRLSAGFDRHLQGVSGILGRSWQMLKIRQRLKQGLAPDGSVPSAPRVLACLSERV
jgi:hypothetical protein